MEKKMAMTLDQPGKKGSAFEIHDDSARRRFDRSGRARGFYEPAMNQHLPALVHLFPIEDPVRMQEIKAIGCDCWPDGVSAGACMRVALLGGDLTSGGKKGSQPTATCQVCNLSHVFRFWS
jgi:hypothetical protein